jgi:DNA-binding transcriptional MerR regulator
VVEVVEDQVAVSERHAAELSGFSVRRLRAWDASGLVRPSITRQLSERNTVRLYTFDDLVELLVASALVDAGRPPRQIRRVVEHLRNRDDKAPLRELRFWRQLVTSKAALHSATSGGSPQIR